MFGMTAQVWIVFKKKKSNLDFVFSYLRSFCLTKTLATLLSLHQYGTPFLWISIYYAPISILLNLSTHFFFFFWFRYRLMVWVLFGCDIVGFFLNILILLYKTLLEFYLFDLLINDINSMFVFIMDFFYYKKIAII